LTSSEPEGTTILALWESYFMDRSFLGKLPENLPMHLSGHRKKMFESGWLFAEHRPAARHLRSE
jgi:hypothetical protein